MSQYQGLKVKHTVVPMTAFETRQVFFSSKFFLLFFFACSSFVLLLFFSMRCRELIERGREREKKKEREREPCCMEWPSVGARRVVGHSTVLYIQHSMTLRLGDGGLSGQPEAGAKCTQISAISTRDDQVLVDFSFIFQRYGHARNPSGSRCSRRRTASPAGERGAPSGLSPEIPCSHRPKGPMSSCHVDATTPAAAQRTKGDRPCAGRRRRADRVLQIAQGNASKSRKRRAMASIMYRKTTSSTQTSGCVEGGYRKGLRSVRQSRYHARVVM